MPYGCHASGYKPYAVEGRSMVAVTHLAWLGVKIQDPAFRGNTKDKKQSFYAAAFVSHKDGTRSVLSVVMLKYMTRSFIIIIKYVILKYMVISYNDVELNVVETKS